MCHPPLIEKLSSLHKDQVFGEKEPREEERPKAGAARSDQEPPSAGTYVLKWYFLLVALALTTTINALAGGFSASGCLSPWP